MSRLQFNSQQQMRFRGFPRDWHLAAQACESDCLTLLREVLATRNMEQRFCSFDRLSQRLCGVVDSAELGRHVLPTQQEREQA